MKKKIFSLLLVIVTIIAILSFDSIVADSDRKTIFIKSEEEFIEFAKNCELDEFSKGKVVVILKDLDFSAADYEPAPIFFGTLKGGGHSIRGIRIKKAGSRFGLFRINEGEILDLRVIADIRPKESASELGMIAGINRGKIVNCISEGTIRGKNNVGGIAGKNSKYGVISKCRNMASLGGFLNVGGIAGLNEGEISICENLGNVNTSKSQVNNTKISNIISIKNLEKEFRGEEEQETAFDVFSCAGGICGRNKGVVLNSKNYNSVGYPHLGYNVGGISGITNGIIKECENTGSVDGRKDVGGIAGQFEPDVMLKYSLEEVEKIKSETKKLMNLFRQLNYKLNSSTQSALDISLKMNKSARVIEESSYKVGREIQDYYLKYSRPIIDLSKQAVRQTNNILDAMDSVIETTGTGIDKADKEFIDSREELIVQREILESVTEDIVAGNDLYNNLVIAIDAVDKSYVIIKEMNESMLGNAGNVKNKNEDSLTEIKENSEALRVTSKKIEREINDYEKESVKEKEQIDKDITEGIYKESLSINDDTDKLMKELKGDAQEVSDLVDQIIISVDFITTTIENLAHLPEYSYKNIISYNGSDMVNGLISRSSNDGRINGDSNVGGICGIVALEVGNDPEKDFAINRAKWGDTKALLRAIIYKSKNSGGIRSKTDYAGGISGMSNLGYIYACSNKGRIEGKNYLGGISGYNEGDIVKCDVLCDINGNNNLGGIAGYSFNLMDNRAMARIESQGEKTGAIAGEIKKDSKLKGNIFVKEDIGGIDGISYSGKAYPMTYEEFTKLKSVPEYYQTLYIHFYDKKTLVKSVGVEYGTSIAEKDIPDIKYNDDYYSEWEAFEKDNIIRSEDVYLIRKPWITSLSDSGDGYRILAEGKFFPQNRLEVEQLPYEYDSNTYRYIKRFRVRVLGEMYEEKNTYNLRVKLEEDEKVSFIIDGEIEELEYKKDGTYAVFDCPKNSELLIIALNETKTYSVFGLSALITLVALLVIIRTIRVKSKKKNKAEEKE